MMHGLIFNFSFKTSKIEANAPKSIVIRASLLKDVPTVPTLSTDGNLLILSANAGRIRYGGCVSFVTVFPQDMPRVMKTSLAKNLTSSIHLDLWCLFEDGSRTPAYSADVPIPNERVSTVDCPLTDFARHELWKEQRTLHVFLVTHRHRSRHLDDDDDEILTLCTSPPTNTYRFFPQLMDRVTSSSWIPKVRHLQHHRHPSRAAIDHRYLFARVAGVDRCCAVELRSLEGERLAWSMVLPGGSGARLSVSVWR